MSEQDAERLCGAPNIATAQVGEAFDQSTQVSTNNADPTSPPTEAPVSVTVKMVKCGISSFPIEPAPGVGAPGPASPGNQFCHATVTIKNVGNAPISDGISIDETTLTASGQSYAADQKSQDIVSALNQKVSDAGGVTGFFAGEVVNPGSTATQALVWQIPKSATAESMLFQLPPTLVTMR